MYKVIIVDDETKIRNGLAHLFPWNQSGFEVVGDFSNGRLAYEYALSHSVDLILSDIRMPVMDGLQLSQQLLSLQDVKIVFFSGYQDFDYARQALKNGVFDYLLKPVKYEDLLNCLERVQTVLDLSRPEQKKTENLSYYDQMIETVRTYIEKEYQNATLERASQLVNLSPNYLSKIMKERSESSFSDYLFETRMKNAARFLRDIHYKQYEIAYRIGYDNPKNFSRAFKQYYHMTPREYRDLKLTIHNEESPSC